MKLYMMRIALLGCLWMGCSNPFSTDSYSPLTGVWGSEIPFREPQSIAFLSNGRYYENQMHVGVYVEIGVEFIPSKGVSGWHHTIRVDYMDGERIQFRVLTAPDNTLELRIFSNTSGRGPVGNMVYNKLHTGDGL